MTAFTAHATLISVLSTLFDYDLDPLTVGAEATDPNGQSVGNRGLLITAVGSDGTIGNGVDDETYVILKMVLTPFSLFENNMFNRREWPSPWGFRDWTATLIQS